MFSNDGCTYGCFDRVDAEEGRVKRCDIFLEPVRASGIGLSARADYVSE